MFVRSIVAADLASLMALARSTGVGVTTLPANEERLSRRIDISERSIAGTAPRQDANYLFVLEDASGAVVGTSAVAAAVGLDEPWYNYRVGLSVHASRELGVYRRLQTLFLTNDMTGVAELCSLFLHTDFRHSNNGALLSKSRFLFLADFPERFSDKVIAEMRGVSDDAGRSPFWESLGRHFFKMDFSQADYLSGIGNKSFIAELMPQHPVYVDFLSEEARAVIGQVHDKTRPALSMLQGEGFSYQGYVDIFDAGPTVECALKQIRAVRESKVVTALPHHTQADDITYLVSNRKLSDFRVCLVRSRMTPAGLPISPEALSKLNLAVGDSVRAVPLSAREE
ncbi:arginine N-succinyltransferase [Chitinivorax tropicus]|uniref:Arginine N-succinyltransferase n=1 Tax=Chitinivorax tropicus TaxID=714531 RepID=A0A840MJW7_9PROT|nr:arginine N-succinyltransferase [Chitinivorax tropicus]MBB5016992.1 arginine N-succinyltransferase [Chitinivorax tropicus]